MSLANSVPVTHVPAKTPRPRALPKSKSKSKKANAGDDGPPICQADGCFKDLSQLTYYHLRNHICEKCIKADVFLRDGQHLRFCQRCGHPHPLDEFDIHKHSCRHSLEKHNARRRKNVNGASATNEDSKKTAAPVRTSARMQHAKRSKTASTSPEHSSALLEGENFAASSAHDMAPHTDEEDLILVKNIERWLDDEFLLGTATTAEAGAAGQEVSAPSWPSNDGQLPEGGSLEIAPYLLDNPVLTISSDTEENVSHKISVKMFDIVPHQLPADLRSQVGGWYEPGGEETIAGLQSYIRPGCLHLLVDNSSHVAPSVEHILQEMRQSGDDVWFKTTMLVQSGPQFETVSLVHNGIIRKSWSVPPRPTPYIDSVSPRVVLASSPDPVVVQGAVLLREDTELVCRLQGKYLDPVEVSCTDCGCRQIKKIEGRDRNNPCCGCCMGRIPASSHAEQTIRVLLPTSTGAPLPPGAITLDMIKGAYMPPKARARILVVNNPRVRDELNRVPLDRVFNDLVAVYDCIGGNGSFSDDKAVKQAAIKILHWSVLLGLMATAEAMLMLINDGEHCKCDSREAANDILSILAGAANGCKATAFREARNYNKWSLLHRAVMSKRQKVVETVLQWGEQEGGAGQGGGNAWRCDEPGVGGITPLHLAAMIPKEAVARSIAVMLMSACRPGERAWTTAVAADGLSCADVWSKMGSRVMDDIFSSEVEVPNTPQHCMCRGSCPCKTGEACCGSETCGEEDGSCRCCATPVETRKEEGEGQGCCAGKLDKPAAAQKKKRSCCDK